MQNSKCDRTCIHADPTPWEPVRIICDRDMCLRSERMDCPYEISVHKRNGDFLKELERYIRETTTVKINPDTPTSIIFRSVNSGIDKCLENIQKGQNDMTETNTERHKRVCYELNALYDKKNRDYGDSFHTTFRKGGMLVSWLRIHDKFVRFEKIVIENEAPNIASETVRDTLIDLANYAIMTVMEMDAEDGPEPMWEKEVQNG